MGIENLAEMYRKSNGKIIILPGCGLNSRNMAKFITCLQTKHAVFFEEFHASCRELATSTDGTREHKGSFSDFGSYRACDMSEVKLCTELVSKLAIRTKIDI